MNPAVGAIFSGTIKVDDKVTVITVHLICSFIKLNLQQYLKLTTIHAPVSFSSPSNQIIPNSAPIFFQQSYSCEAKGQNVAYLLEVYLRPTDQKYAIVSFGKKHVLLANRILKRVKLGPAFTQL